MKIASEKIFNEKCIWAFHSSENIKFATLKIWTWNDLQASN